MIITAIEPRRRGFSQLYIDGEAAVRVDTETLLRHGLRLGADIDDDELHTLLEDSAARRAHEKALYLLEHRAHSRKELEDKITRAEFDREAAKRAAAHMEELGLVDDAQYARSLARELFQRRKFGVRRVKQELRIKGISDEIAQEVLEEFGTDTDETRDNIRAFLEKKYPDAWEDEKTKRRAIAALQRYGYGFDDIFAVLNATEDY